MRHLKNFNESMSKEDLQDFCESTLAYLIDEGFTIKVYTHGDPRSSLPKGEYNIWLQKDKEFFKWDDVKDYYIPFLQLLSNRYDIGSFDHVDETNVRFRYRHKKEYSFVNLSKNFSYARVINDNIFDSEGYWKDHIFYKWIPDPDLISIGLNIKEKSNQIKLEI
jgi:hypothetical protein